MPRVKCPHCGAGNQDAAEQDTCWQCGNVLGAPVARPEPSNSPVMPTVSAPTQQLDPTLLRNLPAAARRSTDAAQRRMAIALTVAVVLIGLLVILLFVLAARR